MMHSHYDRGSQYRRFARVIVAGYTGFWLIVALCFWVVWNAGGYESAESIVARQEQAPTLFNGFAPTLAQYKYAAYKSRKPRVVVIGTSRAMQIREYFFRESFYNLGGLVQGVEQAFAIADRLLVDAPPRTLIFVLDFWTFGRPPGLERKASIVRPTGIRHDGMVEAKRLTLPAHLLVKGLIEWKALWGVATGAIGRTREGLQRFGLSAMIGENGFGADGSAYNFGSVRDGAFGRPLQTRWEEVFERIDAKTGQFVAAELNRGALDQLDLFIDEMSRLGTRVVLLLAPLPGVVVDRMAQEPDAYSYIDDWRQAVKARFPDTLDFHDGRLISSPDAEFLDGFHGGEVTYMRIIRRAAENGGPLAGQVDVALLDRLIRTWRGLPVLVHDPVSQTRRNAIQKLRDETSGRP